MPWTSITTVALPGLPDYPYEFLFYSGALGTLPRGISLESSSAALGKRLRVGFYYPVVFFDSRALVGPCNEMLGVEGTGATSIHLLSYTFFTTALQAAISGEVFGAVVAADRGIEDAVARLWAFT